MISMTRNQAQVSNASHPSGLCFRWYEKKYATAGVQEWITLPDVGRCKVVLSFPTPGAAYLEGTCSPGEVIDGSVASPLGAFSPVTYPLTDEVSETTPLLVEGDTAIRVVALSGNVAISVRC